MLTKRQEHALNRIPTTRKIKDIYFHLDDDFTKKHGNQIILYYEKMEGDVPSSYDKRFLSIYNHMITTNYGMTKVDYDPITLQGFPQDELSKKLMKKILENFEDVSKLHMAISRAMYIANSDYNWWNNPHKKYFMKAIYDLAPTEMKLLFEI